MRSMSLTIRGPPHSIAGCTVRTAAQCNPPPDPLLGVGFSFPLPLGEGIDSKTLVRRRRRASQAEGEAGGSTPNKPTKLIARPRNSCGRNSSPAATLAVRR
jgi:hypothetical protein